MPSEAPQSPEHGPGIPGETPAAPPPDDRLAAHLRGFGPVGILAFVAILLGNGIFAPLSALLVLAWAWRSRTPWRAIGYVRPKSWAGVIVGGIVFGCTFKLLLKTIVMPLLGAPAINPAYHYLVGNPAVVPFALYSVIIGAGFGEETVFRGYLFERLGQLLGSTAGAKTAIVLLTAGWFGLVHYPDQGLAGVEQATIVGLVFGTIYAIAGRIWLLMVTHAAFDLLAVAIIYWDLESAVAHLVFK